ncbi:hypothetical protein BGX26_002914 [Mortierella sp. AD094]|nr:hypothetical protein BGX26_002914 [Mortierella sp. AD094]
MTAFKEKLGLDAESARKFESEVNAEAKNISDDFSHHEFYVGEYSSPEGVLMVRRFRKNGIDNYFTIFKAGLKKTQRRK